MLTEPLLYTFARTMCAQNPADVFSALAYHRVCGRDCGRAWQSGYHFSIRFGRASESPLDSWRCGRAWHCAEVVTPEPGRGDGTHHHRAMCGLGNAACG